MRKFYSTPLLVFIIFLFASNSANAQNIGFEATPVASPPSNWTIVTGTWTINTDPNYVRTGLQSMTITDPATSGTTIGTTNPVNTTTSAGYIITMGWGKSNTASNALFYTGYKSGTTNTFNPTTTTTGQAANVNSTTWSRVVSVSTSGSLAAGNYGIPIRAFRSAATAGTSIYLDDLISYGSASNLPDLTAPNAATGVSLAGNALNWTNGADNGAPASGIGGVVILRADGISLSAPTLNDQAMYSAINGAAGTSSFVQGGVTWTVLTDISGSATTTYTDATASGGPYTYAIFMRDLAYNYSTGVTAGISSPCTTPPTAGVSNVNPSIASCAGVNRLLNLTGNSFGTGQSCQWQSSLTLAGTYTNIGSSSSGSSLTVNPTVTTYYRCSVTCGTSSVNSTPVQVLVNPALPAGVYSINPAQATGGTNYQTFADAINGLSCGIAGPVVFNVTSGTYNEQVIIPAILGTSATNKVTFNGNGATIQATPLTGARHIIKLDGADYVTIKNLTIKSLDATFGWGVHLMGGANNDSIVNCNIDMALVTSTTQANSAGVVASNSSTSVLVAGSNVNNLVVSGNTISGAYQSIILYGTATTFDSSNKIMDNSLQDFYANGIEIVNNKGGVISGNDINRRTRTAVTTFAGIEVGAGNSNLLIDANTIHNSHTSAITQTGTAYGIYFNACDAAVGSENRVTNNVIYNLNSGSGTIYALYNAGSDGAYYYHNTISLDNAASTAGITRGFFQTTLASNIRFVNNIVSISRGGTGIKYCVFYATATSSIVSNNNVLINTSTAGTNGIGTLTATGYATLTDWQAVASNAYDQASISVDPGFTAPGGGNFKPTSSFVNNTGAAVGVTNDYLGVSRSALTPDPGAYEFTTVTAGLNFGAQALVSPASSATGCYSSNETVTIRIRNSSSAAHNFATNPVTVTVNVTGAATQTLVGIVNTGTLASDSTLDVTMPTTLNMSASGAYNFAASTSLVGDANTANDAMLPVVRTKVILAAGIITVTPAIYCGNGATKPTLAVTGNTGSSGLQWQVSNTSTTGFTNITGGITTPYIYTDTIMQDKYYRLVATCGANSLNSNEDTVILVNPSIASTTPGTRCGTGTVNLSATPSAGATIKWYAGAAGGTALATGNTYTTPVISASTTYYVTAGSGQSNTPVPAGNTWNQYTTVGQFQTAAIGAASMVFDALSPITISSLDIYPSAALGSTFTIEVRSTSATGTLIASYTGTTTVVNTTTPSVAQTVPVNFVIPQGTNYVIGFSANPNTWRGNVTNFPYPYVLPGFINIQGSSFGTSPGTTLIYQYFFYNWTVTTGCESARTPVTATVDCAVPITLLNFKGERQGTINKLEWATSTETNNAGFELQRSTDGVNFSKMAFVATKAANGSSNAQLVYSYNDVKPLLGNGYYRLKQIDRDGKSSYSQIVMLKGNKVNTLTISSIYPNPVTDKLNIVLSVPANDRVNIVVTDLMGKIILQKNVGVTIGDSNHQLDVANLAKGTYFIKAVCSNGCETAIQKFVK